MGIPVYKFICASNKNNVLTDFFDCGKYMINREFFKTISPSMDILISSNLERLLFEYYDRNTQKIKDAMKSLSEIGAYSVDDSVMDNIRLKFYADFCEEPMIRDAIKRTYESYGYVMDTHTAVAQQVYEKYKKNTGDTTVTLLACNGLSPL